MITDFKATVEANNVWSTRRQVQTKDWFHSMITDHLIDTFYGDADKKQHVQALEQQILQGKLTVTQGVETLFK